MRNPFLWWSTFLLFAPLLWLQGKYARWRTPRLPEATGSTRGVVAGKHPVLRLAVLGESPVAGVGVECYEDSLASGIARALARSSGRAVEWMAIGENGINLRDTCRRLAPRLAGSGAELVIVALGVNDTTGLTPRSAWRNGIHDLVQAIRRHAAGPIVFAPVPPMVSFTALPQPLRFFLGGRAEQLNDDLAITAGILPGVSRAPVLPPLEARHLSRDGYHPSKLACEEWGEILAGHAAAGLPAAARAE
jgi:lysophospholipase L1-like esterase